MAHSLISSLICIHLFIHCCIHLFLSFIQFSPNFALLFIWVVLHLLDDPFNQIFIWSFIHLLELFLFTCLILFSSIYCVFFVFCFFLICTRIFSQIFVSASDFLLPLDPKLLPICIFCLRVSQAWSWLPPSLLYTIFGILILEEGDVS